MPRICSRDFDCPSREHLLQDILDAVVDVVKERGSGGEFDNGPLSGRERLAKVGQSDLDVLFLGEYLFA